MRRSVRSLLASYLLVGSVEWVLAVALATVIYDRTGSTGWVAASVALRFLPTVVLAPMSGVLADRIDRRWLLVGSCAFRAGGLLLLAAAAAAAAAPAMIVAVAVLDAVLATPFRPAALAMLPTVAPGNELAGAVAALGGVVQLTWIAGPAIGAVAVKASAAFAFTLAALAIAAAAGCVMAISGDQSPRGVSAELPRSAPQMLRDGTLACAAPLVPSSCSWSSWRSRWSSASSSSPTCPWLPNAWAWAPRARAG